jgi:hypothetical protein
MLVGQALQFRGDWYARRLMSRHGCARHGRELRLQPLAMLLEVDVFHRGLAVVHVAVSICEWLHVLLLLRGLRRWCKEVCDLFDAFCEVELRFLS